MGNDIENVLIRGTDPSRPSLENRIAYQGISDISIISVLMDRERNNNLFRIVSAEAASRRAAGKSGIRILDIGCAYGNHIFMLNARLGKDQEVVLAGVELNPEKLVFPGSFARVIPGFQNCSFLNSSLVEGLPFRNNCFDIVLLSEVLEHLQNPQAAMAEIARVLCAGGKAIVTSPLKTSLFKKISRVLNALSFKRLEKAYHGGKQYAASDPEHERGFGHISEMTLRDYLYTGKTAGLEPVDVIPRMIFSGSMFFDRHPFLLSVIMFLEAIHSVLKFKTWGHGIHIVFAKHKAGNIAPASNK
jgi:ubiquinone/menaquinone biosynthesis C-methylase UbiE